MRILVNRPTGGERFGDGLLDAMFRLRARYFNDMRGWGLPLEGGCEIDRFDGAGTLYAAALEEDGTLVGCFRLLPTEQPHLLDSCFPELLTATADTAMRGPGLWEISRLAVIPTEPDTPFRTETVRITAALLGCLFAVCEEIRISRVTCVTDVQFERLLHVLGFDCHRTAGPLRIGVEDCVAGYLDTNAENHAAARRAAEKWARRPVETPLPTAPIPAAKMLATRPPVPANAAAAPSQNVIG
ncbi:acyl-homoserine-lactone synthase [Oceanibaculum nanhaiense]|uniref:acyl-homoserine-lactone synthase n=1 Tax=Oceanibaculum nanhaiense TaxID=1909734 RepID=UPI003F7298DB